MYLLLVILYWIAISLTIIAVLDYLLGVGGRQSIEHGRVGLEQQLTEYAKDVRKRHRQIPSKEATCPSQKIRS